MRFYELTYLVTPDLSEEDLKTLSQGINDFIEQEKGVLGEKTGPIKQKLGCPIKKKAGAFLVILNFSLNPENLEKLEKKLKDENQILRYIILIKKPLEKIPEKVSVLKDSFKKEKISEEGKKPSEPKKIGLKEIDKKIEEILNE